MTQLPFGITLLPVLLVLVAFVLLVVVMTAMRNYIKVPPNKVAVFFGRKHKSPDGKTVGFRLVTGGAAFRWPIVESVTYLDLTIFPIDLDVRDVPNKDGVLVSVQAVANVKIRSDHPSLVAAAERFLGRSVEEIKQIAYKNLEGHLRSIVGRLTMEEIVRDRAKFNQEVLNEATSDLAKIGLGVDVLTIQKVADPEGYIEALGKKRTAEVKRDAQIGEALAARQATIESTTALREGKEQENVNLALVAQAEKERDVRKAQYDAEVQAEQARARQAGPLSEARARQAVVEQEVLVDLARTRKQTEVATAEAERRQQQLVAEVVRPADAAKQQVIIQAEASKQREILEAEGHRQAVVTVAEAEKQRLAMEGFGQAEALKAKLLAEAEGAKAKLLAEAEGTKAKLLAEAEGIRAKLLAEAEGAQKKAAAFDHLDPSARALLVLERLPLVVQAFAPVAGAVAAPMGNIDKLVMIDGGGGSGGSSSLQRLASTVPTTLFQLIQTAQSLGLDLSGVLGALGKPAAEGVAVDAAGAVAAASAPTVEAAGAVKDAAVAARETVDAAAGAAGSVADAVDRVVGAVRGTLPPRPPRV
ncbi:MAG: SPFH domain-containing protein [Thermoanaerobaculaceae bacterium]|jgi:flotillin|nr:SPFH domain-containing protein [Thermoanaerobaculaceae bacterium]